ncbi:MAG TPA: twin-arginine translocation signal domain-containing protein [Thermoleophilia bacterium]|nr:twin-arginine translocation signal domain-containing protein [Thermoleophilia bacterium]
MDDRKKDPGIGKQGYTRRDVLKGAAGVAGGVALG